MGHDTKPGSKTHAQRLESNDEQGHHDSQGRCDESLHHVADGAMIRHILRGHISDDSPKGQARDVQSHMFRPTITDM